MAKPKRIAGTGGLAARMQGRRMTLALSAEQKRDIDLLVAHGLFGLNATDCVRRMIDECLRRRAEEGWVPMAHYTIAEAK